MRRLVFQWRCAWNLVLLAFLLFAVVASAQMALSTSGLNFGSVPVGSTQTLPFTVTNNAKSNLTVLRANVTGAGFAFSGPTLPISLAPQQSVSLSVTFAPQAGGSTTGTMSVVTWTPIGNSGKQRSGGTTISLTGTGQTPGYLGVSPSSINLGSVMVGNSQTQALTLSNTGGSSLMISAVSMSGTGFRLSGISFPYTLAAGTSASLSVVFAPTTAGSANAMLSLSSNASDASVGVVLSGTGTTPTPGYLSAPSSINLGSVMVGNTQTQALTLSNSGGSSVTISAPSVSGAGFSVNGLSFPYTLAAGSSVNLSVFFAPTAAGSASATLSLSSNASDSSVGVVLSGTGTNPNPGYLSAPSSMNLGGVMVGNAQTQALTLSNTGGSSLTISAASINGAGFTVTGISFPYTLAAGTSTSLSVIFAPTAAGSASAMLSLSSNASDASVGVVLSGTGTNPTPGYLGAPSSMNLGSVVVGSSQTQLLTLSNSGGSSLTISAASVSGAGFSVSGLSFPYTLPAGSSASLSVVFTPAVAGSASANLALTSNASDPSVAVALSGTGASPSGTLGVTPGSMSFGSVNIGISQTENGSLTASGGGVTLSSASSSNSQFTLGGLSLPVTIAAGQSVPFTVSFSPTATGSASASVSFFSSGGSVSETATGTGATIQHTVELSWNASTSTSISGYNVYRSTNAAGPYSKISASLNASMNYSDSTVQSGQTYYYVTTAVDSSGVESGYSNQVTAQVPMP